MQIGILTSPDLSRYFQSSRYPNYTHDDQIIIQHFVDKGHHVEPIFWTESLMPSAKDCDVIIVRSPWDYSLDRNSLTTFLSWFAAAEANQLRICNPIPLMRWNLEKTYLKDFMQQGVPVVPTEFIAPETSFGQETLTDCLHRLGPIVVKPAISAAARDTFLMENEDQVSNITFWHGQLPSDLHAWRDGRTLLVQPFLPEVSTLGEYSLVYFGGCFSHCVHKQPKQGSWWVQDELGGTVRWINTPPTAARELADMVMAQLPVAYQQRSPKNQPGLVLPPLYARVDLLQHRGQFLLSEVELIEPELFFLQRDPLPSRAYEPAVELFYAKLCQELDHQIH